MKIKNSKLKSSIALSLLLCGGWAGAASLSNLTNLANLANLTTITASATPAVPRFDHVVIVIMENENQEQIIGNPNAPYINSLANGGANFSDSHGVTHPSQPNYLALFSGSTQGVTDDTCPVKFTGKANLGRQLIDAGLSFTGYSEDMPSAGYTGCSFANYARKHNPWSDFDNVPVASNQPFTAFPATFENLPTVSVVVPNLCNDDHDCPTSTGDAWLKKNMDAYVQWAKTHNSLLILTWDEDAFRAQNLIPTIFSGALVRPGKYANTINHYSILRTLETMYGLPAIGNAANATAITNVWTTSPPPPPPPSNVLQNGIPVTNLAAAAGSSLNYTMVVPAGATNLKFGISGGTGDGDMYVKFGSAPTDTSYDCRPYLKGNAESCPIATAKAGTYYIRVKSYATFSGVSLLGSYTAPAQ